MLQYYGTHLLHTVNCCLAMGHSTLTCASMIRMPVGFFGAGGC